MNWTRRLGTSFAACLLLVAVATPLANAEDVVAQPEPDLLLTVGTSYYAVVGTDTKVTFTLYNTGNVPIDHLEWDSTVCDLPDPEPEFALAPFDHVSFECMVPPPGGGDLWLIEGKAVGMYDGAEVPTDVHVDLYPATIRKAVVRYWDFVHKVNYAPGADVMFPIHLYLSNEYIGTEQVSKNQPLRLWLRPGEWAYAEGEMPDGYLPARDADKFVAGPDSPRYDNTLFNYIPFDLSVEKSGPMLTPAGAPVTYTYNVENAGPGSVAPLLGDNQCDPITYVSGDTDTDDLVDPGEVWVFECTMTPDWTFNEPFTNYVTVRDADYPADWVPRFGGDTNLDDNTDTFTLYPFVLRKGMFLYWDSPANTIPYEGLGDVEFPVKAANDSGEYFFTISESAPAHLWLAEGTWTFTEEYVHGYDKGYENIVFETGRDYPDWTYPNVALFDLWVEKAGPQWSLKGEKVTFTYRVHNDGPASVTPMIADDKCDAMVLVGGDADMDGLIDPAEIWDFECTMVPDWTFPEPFTNTVRVWDEEGEPIEGWHLGGDVNFDNNTASYTLYPFVLRKDMFLYWDSPANTIPIDGFEDLLFEVAVTHNGDPVDHQKIGENDPVMMFLAEGKWVFTEIELPEGIVSGYDDITYVTGEGYPDWTFPNVALFDLSVEKKLWWGTVLPGETIAYKYKVRNAGPAPVTPVIDDDLCAPLRYKWGDQDEDGLVDPGETWVFKCKYTVVEPPFSNVTNTVKVTDAEGEGLSGWYLGGDTNPANNTDTLTLEVEGWYACQAWCWRHHDHLDDWPDGYTPDMLVGKVFGLWKKLDLDRDGKPDTLEDALGYQGAKGLLGLKRKLMKAAVTALLNEAEYGDWYPAYESEDELIDEVNHVFRSKKRWKMKQLTKELRLWNDGYCAL